MPLEALGGRSTGRLVAETTVGEGEEQRAAVVPTVTGRAWVTGTGQHLLDPTAPFPTGFTF